MSKKLTTTLCAFALVLALSILATAQDHKSMSWTGNIVDKACSAKVSKAENPGEAAATHKKGCSLSEGCLKSGLGLFADGKFVEFDEKGAGLAKSALEKTSKANGAKFKVTGMLHDGKLMVENITEVE